MQAAVSYQFTRIDKVFNSQGDALKAWLYLPVGVSKPPLVVMAHGFGGQRWMRLPAYAEHFARMGMAVFLFDYRGFNDSEGEPRNYINPSRHLEDWDAAIAFVKTLDSVDGKRMALWGTSFSGGHVIVEAAKHPEVRAVVSQVPFTDGISTEWNYFVTDPSFSLRGLYHGLADVFVSLFTSGRHHVRIVGRPGENFAMMCQPDSMAGLMKLLGPGIDEKDFEKDNYCPGNIVFTLGLYRPIGYAEEVACPTLVIGAEKDTLFPPTGPKKMADRMKKATYISMPMNHFDPYVGEPFEKLVRVMGDFLQTNLK
ncbi:MAG TPA: alpha/beta fold hydrolase [Spirochaetota bacterium]|nr:alpha/beta fold hydrolase [Spirochaetota bacterium]HRZ25771.1 alpha/beta fold hydrolase [Spirochaetota bacterium]HSA14726.1 alpha/beta fold hydrolase [Spirochaetota bacterium]